MLLLALLYEIISCAHHHPRYQIHRQCRHQSQQCMVLSFATVAAILVVLAVIRRNTECCYTLNPKPFVGISIFHSVCGAWLAWQELLPPLMVEQLATEDRHQFRII